MLVLNFTLTTPQLQVLLAFRNQPDTRTGDGHPMNDVDHTVSVLRKLCRDGYLDWHHGDRERGLRPGYTLTDKGEMMLKVVEDELRRTLGWFGGEPLPVSSQTSGASDVATGKCVYNKKGVAVRKSAATNGKKSA